eukprot:3053001-Pyramimonas_sp.AAC.1
MAPPDPASFFCIRPCCALYVLAALIADSSSGPDLVLARVLKACARELAAPKTLIARSVLARGRWPEIRCQH